MAKQKEEEEGKVESKKQTRAGQSRQGGILCLGLLACNALVRHKARQDHVRERNLMILSTG